MYRVCSCLEAKGLELLLKPLDLKDALMIFGTLKSEPMPIRKDLIVPWSI